ncbi:MAG: hypothetical protein U0X91_00970 [Spirosomataceae bacterium]
MIFSLIAATVIWLFNELNKEGYTQQVQYPINLTYNDSLYIPTTPLPTSASVTLTGSGWSLLRKSLPFTVKPIDYPMTNPLGMTTINTGTLASIMSERVKDVKISHIVLENTGVDFEERMVKTSVLKIDSSGIDLFPKFVVSSIINLRPNTVTFDGPASLVTDIPDTIMVRVPAKKIRGNYDEELPIRYPQSPLLKAGTERVFVSFEVAEFLGTIPSDTAQKAKPAVSTPAKAKTTGKKSKKSKKK